jgi:death-on-curing protein
VRYLTVDEVIDLNRRVTTECGGLFSIRDRHRVEYLVDIVRDDEQFPTVWGKAAMYVHRLATSQAFLDGNKRTALEAGDVFLAYNGYNFRHPGVMETVEFMLAVARKEKKMEDVAVWLKRHSRRSS